MQKDNGSVVCSKCKSGFTVTEDGSQCNYGVDIENCYSGIIIGGKTYCWICNDGFIGVFNTKVYAYNACLTCRSWQCHLLTGDAQKCCFNEKY